MPIYLTNDGIFHWVRVMPPADYRKNQGITTVITIHPPGTMNGCINVMAINPIARYRYFSLNQSVGQTNLHCHPQSHDPNMVKNRLF